MEASVRSKPANKSITPFASNSAVRLGGMLAMILHFLAACTHGAKRGHLSTKTGQIQIQIHLPLALKFQYQLVAGLLNALLGLRLRGVVRADLIAYEGTLWPKTTSHLSVLRRRLSPLFVHSVLSSFTAFSTFAEVLV